MAAIDFRSNYKVPKAPEVLQQEPLLPTLYLKSHTTLELAEEDPNYLYLKNPEHSFGESVVLFKNIRAILAFEPFEIKPTALGKLLRSQVPIILFAESGEYLGRVEPSYTTRPDLIRAQALMSEQQKLHLTQIVVWGVLRRCRRFLLKAGRERTIPPVAKAADTMQLSIDAIFNCTSIECVQGHLGQALLAYYPALFKGLSTPGWEYDVRSSNKPLNRMLTFTYNLLHEFVKSAIYAVGLNPMQGHWHKSCHSREALVEDISFQFKPYVDTVVIRILNLNQVALKDFDDEWWESKSLPPKVVRVIMNSFERKMSERFTYPNTKINCSYQEAIYLQTKLLALYLTGQCEYYCPLDLK